MPSTLSSLFISYSRTDSAFVDRLEGDLQAHNFHTWVDRSELKGGQDWLNELEEAIEQCQILLVVLSPEAVASKYVKMEYRQAIRLDKHVIPLEYRVCPKVPMALASLQFVSFKVYEQGLNNLLRALNSDEVKESRVAPSTKTAVEQRKRILQILYEARSDPLKPLDREDLARLIGQPWYEIQPDVAYLEEKGYIITKRRQISSLIFYRLNITTQGVDVVEGRILL